MLDCKSCDSKGTIVFAVTSSGVIMECRSCKVQSPNYRTAAEVETLWYHGSTAANCMMVKPPSEEICIQLDIQSAASGGLT